MDKLLIGELAGGILFLFGISCVIGAIKDWDWLFKPDVHYQNNWTIGQISRYLGRKMARLLGFAGGLLIAFAGGYWFLQLTGLL